MVTKEEVINAIKQCYDPEIPVNVYDLGLVYDVDVKPKKVNITMTLTTQLCPSAQAIPDQIQAKIQKECKIDQVKVSVVWDPPWTPDRITADGKKVLGLDEEDLKKQLPKDED